MVILSPPLACCLIGHCWTADYATEGDWMLLHVASAGFFESLDSRFEFNN